VVSPWTVGGHIFSEVSDHTSPLRLIEAITASKGLSGKGPVTFDSITRWRRETFSDFTGVFKAKAQPAPTSREFDEETRLANLNAQAAASTQPMPQVPGATQHMPSQEH
jgi:phospholipase C